MARSIHRVSHSANDFLLISHFSVKLCAFSENLCEITFFKNQSLENPLSTKHIMIVFSKEYLNPSTFSGVLEFGI